MKKCLNFYDTKQGGGVRNFCTRRVVGYSVVNLSVYIKQRCYFVNSVVLFISKRWRKTNVQSPRKRYPGKPAENSNPSKIGCTIDVKWFLLEINKDKPYGMETRNKCGFAMTIVRDIFDYVALCKVCFTLEHTKLCVHYAPVIWTLRLVELEQTLNLRSFKDESEKRCVTATFVHGHTC